jgi:hypothetical protein
MLRDPRAESLVDRFAVQWLGLGGLAAHHADDTRFPEFDADLRQAMGEESRRFLLDLVRGDRSVLALLTADYSFVNARLARHYGIPGVQGERFRRVAVRNLPRRGIISQASILTMTSELGRTSPVRRGKWVLEALLGTPPPPPPPNVPALPERGRRSDRVATLRERLEEHRSRPACIGCHRRMDAIGLGLENFDALGRWRTHDAGSPIDASGTLDGDTGHSQRFRDPRELFTVIARHRRQFLTNLVSKTMIFALGRGPEAEDGAAVDTVVDRLHRNGFRFSELIAGVVTSEPFRTPRGEGKKR